MIKLKEIMQKYKPKGILKGSELLLSHEDAICLVDELENIDILVVGFSSWRYLRPNDVGAIQEVLEQEFFIKESDSVKHNVIIIKEAINTLPKEVSFVSLDLDIPLSWLNNLFVD